MRTRKASLAEGVSQALAPSDGRLTSPRQMITDALGQFQDLWKPLLMLYVLVSLLFVILRVVSNSSDRITLSYLTRDVAAIANLPFYAGLLSQLGALLWAASLGICIFAFIALHHAGQNFAQARRWLIQASILTALLTFDDVFQFHEEIGQDYLGLSEKVIVLSYVALALVFLITNYKEILNSEYLFLGLALLLFGISILLDGAHLEKLGTLFNDQIETFIEDGLKFAGVATWLVYFGRYAYQNISALLQQ